MSSESKPVKTLLLCKIASEPGKSYVESYKKIYDDHKEAKHYITLGSFDALSVYDIQSKTDGRWLEAVLGDKRTVISTINSSVSYHPVHLVFSAGQADVPDQSTYPFLFVVFAYGALRSVDQIEKYICDSFPDRAGIYNCINISDRVILIYSDDVVNTLTQISCLEMKGYFRKTYTTVSFPMTQEGEVQSFALGKLKDANVHANEKLGISIQGTLRSKENWEAILYNPKKKDGEMPLSNRCGLCSILNSHKQFFSFGEEDFTITADTDEQHLANLLEFFINYSTEISNACWDIHTELQLLGDTLKTKALGSGTGDNSIPLDIEPVLSTEYDRFHKVFFSEDSSLPKPTTDYPWRFALQEVFSAQQKIDVHPLLHGPAYVVYDFLRVMNDYYESAFPLKSSSPSAIKPITDIGGEHIRDVILPRSQERIERAIRSLSQLTDQLTRNDDVLFRGLGRVPAIAATLPENLLEFYHAFLREIAEYLVEIDKKTDYINTNSDKEEFEYGFLLAPELNQRMRLSQLFKLELEDQLEPQKQGDSLSPHIAWPKKQAHLIQFPADDIFRPVQCFFPLAHECFHYFGNKLRFRDQRFQFMALFVSAVFVASLNLDAKEYEEYFWGVFVQLSRKDQCIKHELYLDRAADIIRKNLEKLISENGIVELVRYVAVRSDRSAAYAYSEIMQRTIRESVDRFPVAYADSNTSGAPYLNTVVKACVHLFKECYADRMAISVLNVTPSEYLLCCQGELQSFGDFTDIEDESEMIPLSGDLISLCQRIAVVLAVDYNLIKHESATVTVIDSETITTLRQGIYSKRFGGLEPIGKIIERCLRSLVFPDTIPLQNQDKNGNSYQGVLPVHALFYVVEYLTEAVNYLNRSDKLFTDEELAKKPDLKEDFDLLVRKEGFFSARFNEIIKENRDRIDRLVNPQKTDTHGA